MKCDECKRNEATYHSIKKINGATTERHLCGECQKKYGGFKTMKMSGFSDFFSSLAGVLNEPQPDIKVCSHCGCSADDFLQTGFVGCSACYAELGDVILSMIQKMQGDTQHVGKVPLGAGINTEYERLKRELDKVIAIENYEQASVIRDKMRRLKGEE